jgi:hypothetical protein
VSDAAIPLAGARTLARVARRTALVRAALALVLVLLAGAAILLGRHPHVREIGFLPRGTNGIVVLDLSASISPDTYSRIGASLRDLASSDGRFGLVIFSDTAYEALPPGSPADALKPMLRYFTLPKQRIAGAGQGFPENPWTRSFSAGTRISTGLDLARSILIDERPSNPGVLLISDLDDDLSDIPALTTLASTYKQEHIRLNVVALNASADDEQVFRRFLRGNGTLRHARPPAAEAAPAATTSFPLWLALAALAVALLLGANELWTARLTWAGEPERGAA